MRSPVIGANRIHSQSIKKLGTHLRVVAVDNDSFVQAIENTRGQWLMGIQWHTEYLLYHGCPRRSFSHFEQAAEDMKLIRLAEPVEARSCAEQTTPQIVTHRCNTP